MRQPLACDYHFERRDTQHRRFGILTKRTPGEYADRLDIYVLLWLIQFHYLLYYREITKKSDRKKRAS